MATDDKVSVILTSTDAGGSVKQKSFTYISPDATNGQLKTFAQAANALTNNSYNGSKKVTQVDLDSADPDQQKQTATITLATTSATLADVKAALKIVDRFYYFIASYDGDGQLYAFVESSSNPDDNQYIGVSPYVLIENNTYGFCLFSCGRDAKVDELTAPITVKIRADATDNYKAAEATFTITA